jgi:hypothetical protein
VTLAQTALLKNNQGHLSVSVPLIPTLIDSTIIRTSLDWISDANTSHRRFYSVIDT